MVDGILEPSSNKLTLILLAINSTCFREYTKQIAGKYFLFLRYFISGIIAIPFLIHHYYFNGFPKVYKNDAKLFFKDVVIWGTIVSVVAIAAIMANYYLLEKYDSSFVTPIAEAILLIFNALFSVWILGEKFTTDMGIGLGCIILGILFIYRGKLKLF